MFNELVEDLQKLLDDGISKPAAVEFVSDAVERLAMNACWQK